MTRRIPVAAIAAVAALGVAAAPAAAAKKNEIRIVGGTKFKAGKYVKDDVRFKPMNVTVKSGATVNVVNKGLDPAPHTISFVEKAFLPKSFEFAAIGPLMMDRQLRRHHWRPFTVDPQEVVSRRKLDQVGPDLERRFDREGVEGFAPPAAVDSRPATQRASSLNDRRNGATAATSTITPDDPAVIRWPVRPLPAT